MIQHYTMKNAIWWAWVWKNDRMQNDRIQKAREWINDDTPEGRLLRAILKGSTLD